MQPVRIIQWPDTLMQYVKGVSADAVGAVDARGNASAGRLDLLCSQPTSHVATFKKLTELVARVAVANPQYQLFFRGQSEDYKLGPLKVHSLCPSLWRGLADSPTNQRETLASRCRMLFKAGEVLVSQYQDYAQGEAETKRLLRDNPLARWAILQHYELCSVQDGLCGTPMIDLTQSLHVAASFALQTTSKGYGYLYILGMPYQREMFSVDSRSGITCVSLLGAMPSTALRPYVQNGYLATDNDWWRLYAMDNEPSHDTYMVNFADRLVAVVRIGGDDFWDDTSGGPLGQSTLYPEEDSFQEFVEKTNLRGLISDALTQPY